MKMSAAQSGKKSQPQKKVKQPPGAKTLGQKTQTKEKKAQLKQGKEEPKTPAVRPRSKRKETGQPSSLPTSKTARVGQQRKAHMTTKGSRKVASPRSASRCVSPKAKRVKVGRNLCFFSSRDLQYEVNEMMRKELTARLFAHNPHKLH